MKSGEPLTEKMNVFKVQVENYYKQENCISAFAPRVPIKVHFEREEELKMKYDPDAVDQAIRAWNLHIEKIVYPPPRRADHDVGLAKCEAWDHIVRYYVTSAESEKTKLEKQ